MLVCDSPSPATFLQRKNTTTMRTPFTLYAVVRDKPALCRNQRVYTKGVDSSHNKNIAPAQSCCPMTPHFSAGVQGCMGHAGAMIACRATGQSGCRMQCKSAKMLQILQVWQLCTTHAASSCIGLQLQGSVTSSAWMQHELGVIRSDQGQRKAG